MRSSLRFAFAVMALGVAAHGLASAQNTTVKVTVPQAARFTVDGQVYLTSANFTWPAGSTHVLVFLTDNASPSCAVSQTTSNADTQICFTGWIDNQNLVVANGATQIIVTASPTLTSLTAQVTLNYRVMLNFFNSPSATLPLCTGDPGAAPPGGPWPGIVYIGTNCYIASANVYLPAGAISFNAFPFPGFVFTGWLINPGSATPSFLTSYNLQSPVTLAPQFQPAKRVSFLTSPLQLQLLIDHTATLTPSSAYAPGATCPATFNLPSGGQATIPGLCFGEFDFVPGSSHVIGGVSPQSDVNGKTWMFDHWSNGAGQDATYVADTNTATYDQLTAFFVPGARVSFVTNPPGLQLSVDGRINWPAYNFVWALGSSHQVAPVASQSAGGRAYTFQGWSNAGPLTQTVSVDQGVVDNSLTLIANFTRLSRLVIQSSPPGLTVQVDGNACGTPCAVDRPLGTMVALGAPPSVPTGDGARLDLTGWSDGTTGDHTFSITQDLAALTVSYSQSYRLSVQADPPGGALFQVAPPSPDSFYPANSAVNVTAQAQAGFKFRSWDLDLSGTSPSGTVSMSGPRNVLAHLDKVPYISPVGVLNGAGNTPNPNVAAGSIVAIYGANLASGTQAGPVDAMLQTLAGASLTVNGRLLPLFFASPSQINALLPSDLSPGDYTLIVHSNGQPDVSTPFTVVRNAPGIFATRSGSLDLAVAFHGDGTPVTLAAPARAGETVAVWGTGFGPFNNPPAEGFAARDPLPALVDAVTVNLGAEQPAVQSALAAKGSSGIVAVKFTVPADAPSGGPIQLAMQVNGQPSNTVWLPIQ